MNVMWKNTKIQFSIKNISIEIHVYIKESRCLKRNITFSSSNFTFLKGDLGWGVEDFNPCIKLIYSLQIRIPVNNITKNMYNSEE